MTNDRLTDQMKKFLGIAPYDDGTNFVAYDGYFYASMVKEFGEETVEKKREELYPKRKIYTNMY